MILGISNISIDWMNVAPHLMFVVSAFFHRWESNLIGWFEDVLRLLTLRPRFGHRLHKLTLQSTGAAARIRRQWKASGEKMEQFLSRLLGQATGEEFKFNGILEVSESPVAT